MTRYGNNPFWVVNDLRVKVLYSSGPLTLCFSILTTQTSELQKVTPCSRLWNRVPLEDGWFISIF